MGRRDGWGRNGGGLFLRLSPGKVFFVLGFAAFMAEAGVLGKDGSAGTAWWHIFSVVPNLRNEAASVILGSFRNSGFAR